MTRIKIPKTPNNQHIVDAALLILNKNLRNTSRPLRLLVDQDFDRIRQAKIKISRAWSNEEHKELITYHSARSQLLDRWSKKHNWHPTTRNLYASILSKLMVWEESGISKEDQDLLRLLRPGAQLHLQFLQEYQMPLV